MELAGGGRFATLAPPCQLRHCFPHSVKLRVVLENVLIDFWAQSYICCGDLSWFIAQCFLKPTWYSNFSKLSDSRANIYRSTCPVYVWWAFQVKNQ